jgi:hypothetical protein
MSHRFHCIPASAKVVQVTALHNMMMNKHANDRTTDMLNIGLIIFIKNALEQQK